MRVKTRGRVMFAQTCRRALPQWAVRVLTSCAWVEPGRRRTRAGRPSGVCDRERPLSCMCKPWQFALPWAHSVLKRSDLTSGGPAAQHLPPHEGHTMETTSHALIVTSRPNFEAGFAWGIAVTTSDATPVVLTAPVAVATYTGQQPALLQQVQVATADGGTRAANVSWATAVYWNQRHAQRNCSAQEGVSGAPEALFGWLIRRANQDTGMWGHPVPGNGQLQVVNGYYRATRGSFAQFGLPVPYPRAVVDTVLNTAATPVTSPSAGRTPPTSWMWSSHCGCAPTNCVTRGEACTAGPRYVSGPSGTCAPSFPDGKTVGVSASARELTARARHPGFRAQRCGWPSLGCSPISSASPTRSDTGHEASTVPDRRLASDDLSVTCQRPAGAWHPAVAVCRGGQRSRPFGHRSVTATSSSPRRPRCL